MDLLVALAAELMSLPTDSTSLPTPPIVWQETQPSRVATLKIINLVFIVLLEGYEESDSIFPAAVQRTPHDAAHALLSFSVLAMRARNA